MNDTWSPPAADPTHPVIAPANDANAAESAIRAGRRAGTVTGRNSAIPGVRVLVVHEGPIIIHQMFVVDSGTFARLYVSDSDVLPWSPRLVSLCGAQLWLVVPNPNVADAQALLQRHGMQPRVCGYGRDRLGILRLEWW